MADSPRQFKTYEEAIAYAATCFKNRQAVVTFSFEVEADNRMMPNGIDADIFNHNGDPAGGDYIHWSVRGVKSSMSTIPSEESETGFLAVYTANVTYLTTKA